MSDSFHNRAFSRKAYLSVRQITYKAGHFRAVKPTQYPCPGCRKEALCGCCSVCRECGFEGPFCNSCGNPALPVGEHHCERKKP